MINLRNLSLVRLSAALTACVAMLAVSPQVASAADHALHTIKYANIGNSMKDGDNISVTECVGGCASDEIRITLELGSRVTWWKGALLFKKDANNDYLSLCELQDDKKKITTIVDLETFRNRHFVLSKAKAFGVHTNMYFVEDASYVMKGGHTYVFRWTKD